jgi:hypothetical protein
VKVLLLGNKAHTEAGHVPSFPWVFIIVDITLFV